MLASARAFLEHLIDYAGMFPPAKLPMDNALQNYTRYAASPDAWMLGRFVCQTPKLAELTATLAQDGGPAVLAVAALGRGGHNLDELADRLDADRVGIADFRRTNIQPTVGTVELLVPPALPASDLAQFVDYLGPRLMLDRLRAFLELPLSAHWEANVRSAGAMLAAARAYTCNSTPAVGLKLRCGGTGIPSVEQVASFVHLCSENDLPWKATAGLHHPLRHRDGTSQMAHGFINVFGAGILARVHRLNVEQIAEILREESAEAFRFNEAGFAWRDWSCTVDQIREARQWMPSFGSCSFDEPRDDLLAMALID